jgi:hypothetical protein
LLTVAVVDQRSERTCETFSRTNWWQRAHKSSAQVRWQIIREQNLTNSSSTLSKTVVSWYKSK